ncbi:Protein of unknown function [Haladaptatus litoreus]|uniref:DUF1214 domain-containing protein n=1 Tax=Haladaptatus litoreus TaxID=553468 RepID=A0A1N7EGP8_9EURY|nr:DUF1214 domain-containing protein [Haladaptatus litoreus]SIR87224.1 Protein of unknown function [Haladaptatus litoreus]
MTNETYDTPADAESDSGLMRTTRRTALRGAELVGLLAMGVGSASANQETSSQTTKQALQQTTDKTETVPVTWKNFPRAQFGFEMASYVKRGGFGKFYHHRTLFPINKQVEAATNRDTLYSGGFFDLTKPVTITKPDTDNRYQSMVVINADQYLKMLEYEPGEYTLTEDDIGTRYAGVLVRTFVDPKDPNDVATAHRLQNELTVSQDSAGTFEIPNWDRQSHDELFDALTTVGKTMDNFDGAYGDVGQVNPVKFLLASVTPFGFPASETIFLSRVPAQNDGTTPYELTVKNVPVDGFWSITVYNHNWYLEKNKYDAYSVNNVTAERNADGSVTVHFGGDPNQSNFLYTPKGWNYMVRLYQPRKAILDGSYQFPKAQPIK